MLHCLAYGNSDQASFRNLEVRRCFDVMSVPSTIASYYQDATAGFVLSSRLDYFIEPRTPLFQEVIRDPRASHYTLASTMGQSVVERLGRPSEQEGQGVRFPAEFYSSDVCDEVVSSMISFQRDYGGRAEHIAEKLNRYKSLLDRAQGGSGNVESESDAKSPTYLLCPYFAARTRSSDWWEVTQRLWASAQRLDRPNEISPVVAITELSMLEEAILCVPDHLSSRIFFWVPGFDERTRSVADLRSLRATISVLSGNRKLMNLYGGYFSILLGKVGLAGFNNGLGYSESRDWPTLDATGAAPARYYVRKLHAYMPTAAATSLVEVDRAFACECSVCGGGARRPNELDYHQLKRHFALARAWEMQLSEENESSQLRDAMREDEARATRARRRIPGNVRIPLDHLSRWAAALE